MRYYTRLAAALACVGLLTSNCRAQNPLAYRPGSNALRHTIAAIIKPYNAQTGVAIICIEDRDTLTIGNTHHYPMQSVFKFPLALYILKQVDNRKLKLSQHIHISKGDLRPNTWSPLRGKYPDGNVDLELGEVLNYSVSKSDNNACDILFGLAGGTKPVNDYIHGLGVKEIAIAATELQMTKGWNVQYTNWAKPFAMATLLELFYKGQYLSKSSTAFLVKLMTESANSAERIKGLLPAGTVVAHKTGTSDTNKKGVTAATNDVGIITLPNGKHVAIAVFVSDTKENSKTNEHIIAAVAKALFDEVGR